MILYCKPLARVLTPSFFRFSARKASPSFWFLSARALRISGCRAFCSFWKAAITSFISWSVSSVLPPERLSLRPLRHNGQIDIDQLPFQVFPRIDADDVAHLILLALEDRILGPEGLARQQQNSCKNDDNVISWDLHFEWIAVPYHDQKRVVKRGTPLPAQWTTGEFDGKVMSFAGSGFPVFYFRVPCGSSCRFWYISILRRIRSARELSPFAFAISNPCAATDRASA